MSKLVKEIMLRDYSARMNDADGNISDVMLIDIRAVKGTDTTKFRAGLRKKDMHVTMVRNSLARKAFKGTKLEPLADMLSGSTAVAYGGNSIVEVAREVMTLIAKMPSVQLKGAILDGIIFKGRAGVEELSKYPTKEEAIARVVTLVVSPGRNLMGQVKGPGSTVAGLIKSIETKLEKGEVIAANA